LSEVLEAIQFQSKKAGTKKGKMLKRVSLIEWECWLAARNTKTQKSMVANVTTHPAAEIGWYIHPHGLNQYFFIPT
jgi:hypothetical protein